MSGNKSIKPDHSAELLDFPSRSEAIAKLLSDTTESLQKPSTDTAPPTIPPPELRKTFKMPVKSDLMARLQTFLPELESANRQLDQQVSVDPKKVDIENVDDNEQYIEMNLGLGVFEEKKPSASSSDEESEVDESIIINPFSAAVADKNPGITLMDQDQSEDEDSASDESAESCS
ncbi:hypothetical protein K450DRAFT_231407 [Umbelopsis ramanniana AG]|uniref:Uncharacterized protein n=1 Tax=Umbelopsis ramanniana AG TaxID=1314678 RepID=A0AAD5EDD5_UMBRA|nr:uncharacterized protein K450DRAFT_231407 [Umbelopsis ramanniana AG]KAI8581841.1 hypothetical protein K450DRAFT_231407 [Umbelopsis ramanniana AG]